MRVNKETYEKHVRAFGPGKTIFLEKDPGSEMYVIIAGQVEIRKATSSSSSKTLIVLGKGDIFGEMAIIEKKRRSATAVSVANTNLLVLDENLFEVTLDKNPDFARKMIRVLSERLRRANSALQASLMTSRQSMVLAGLVQYAPGLTLAKANSLLYKKIKILFCSRCIYIDLLSEISTIFSIIHPDLIYILKLQIQHHLLFI